MKKTNSNKKKVLMRAAAFVLTAAFLLGACGMAKGENTASQSAYSTEESGGDPYSFKEESYGYSAAAEESGEAEEAMGYAADTAAADTMDVADPMDADAGAARVQNEAGTGADGTEDPDGQADPQSSNRKIVYTGNISLQTLEYDDATKSIHDKINSYGGFIESENTSNDDPYWYYSDRSGANAKRTRRNLSITARIPADKFEAFMKDLEKDGQVINTSVNAQNISVSYANHDASRKALEIEQERLLKMMEKAETIEDMIAVEERLTQVERELGSEKTVLSDMDRDVNFSTIYINLEEVFEYSESVVETTYGERLKRAFGNAIEGFVEFWQDLLLFVVGSFPFLIMLAILIAVIVKLVRRGRRRRAEKREAWRPFRRNAAPGPAAKETDSNTTGKAEKNSDNEKEVD